MRNFERYVTIINSGETKRFHTRKMFFEQTVAQHSFNCALLVHELANYIGISQIDSNKCMLHMLIHDVPEHVFGDVPGHIKGRNPLVKETFDKMESDWMNENFPPQTSKNFNDNLNDLETLLCKFVDLVDCFYKASYEYEMGNTRPTEAVIANCGNAAKKIVEHCEKNCPVVMGKVLRNFYDDMITYFR